MDFQQHVPLGQTGLMVSRLGIASGFGVPAASIEEAFHEHNLNYFFVSFGKRRQIKIALHNLLPQYRDKTVIALPYFPVDKALFLRRSVEAWLRRLNLDTIDIILLQDVKPSQRLFDRALKLKTEGKVRFIGISSHKRPLLGRIASGELKLPVDLFYLRYNVVHRGAEEDIFPHLARDNDPGIVAFTATCWRKPLKIKNMPAGEAPLNAADCCRFVLSNHNVNVCITGPSNAQQMEENLTALTGGPLSDEEMTRVKRIGDHIYQM
ncbi:MAG: aldo/keto reductase [candidate division Zixibacteria bacterium]|nr:aldo/keto reductase [candidate division Zixibacteria bacterium]